MPFRADEIVKEAITVLNVVWDMETNDPDDFLTLLLLAGHPLVNLKAVTVVPGSTSQVGLIRFALKNWFGLNIPVGVHNLNSEKPSVSEWHYQAFGRITPSRDALPATEVMLGYCDETTTLIMGAPLTNLRSVLNTTGASGQEFRLGNLFIQGGFAGQGVVSPELQLEKFKGLTTYPSHNLISDQKAALAALAFNGVRRKHFVSKNVCHRALYNGEVHKRIELMKDKSLSLALIWQGMETYLRENPAGKILHDPLTACCAINEVIAIWAEVELYREGNRWGANLAPNSATWITIDYIHEQFIQTLMMY